MLAILLPTRNRSHKIKPLVENIKATTKTPYRLYFAICDESTKKVCDDNGYHYIESMLDTYYKKINELYRLTTEEYMFTASDDYLFYDGWDTKALRHDKGLVGVNDVHHALYPPEYPFGEKSGSAFIVKRSLADKLGEIFHEGYRHAWGDVELIKRAGGEFVYEPKSVVEHMHWKFGLSDHDSTYIEHEEEGGSDYELYIKRNG